MFAIVALAYAYAKGYMFAMSKGTNFSNPMCQANKPVFFA